VVLLDGVPADSVHPIRVPTALRRGGPSAGDRGDQGRHAVPPRRRGWRGRLAIACAAVCGAMLAVLGGLLAGIHLSGGVPVTPVTSAPAPVDSPASGVPGVPERTSPTSSTASGVTTASPTRVASAVIGLDADLVQLGTAPDGSIEVPSAPQNAGWLTGSAVPGETGPAVIAGHVDSLDGPAVFYRLGELAVGDIVTVSFSDGSSTEFAVTQTIRTPKNEFPTDRVYGPVPDAQLRLITCGGAFDGGQRSYQDNIVVFARRA